MSQTVWFFPSPTISWCTVHESTDFHYSSGEGLRCAANSGSDKDCDSSCWVDFTASDLELSDAEEHASKYNEWVNCGGCQDQMRATELPASGLCDACKGETLSTDDCIKSGQHMKQWEAYCGPAPDVPDENSICSRCGFSNAELALEGTVVVNQPYGTDSDRAAEGREFTRLSASKDPLKLGVDSPGAPTVYSVAYGVDDDHGYTDHIDGRPQLDDSGNIIHDPVTCGTCGRTWNDAIISDTTPVPSARCPFEYEHEETR